MSPLNASFSKEFTFVGIQVFSINGYSNFFLVFLRLNIDFISSSSNAGSHNEGDGSGRGPCPDKRQEYVRDQRARDLELVRGAERGCHDG
jgi:hypothetical protein